MCTDAKNRITLSIINIAAVQLLHLLLGRERNIRTHALMHARTRIDTDTHRHRHTQTQTHTDTHTHTHTHSERERDRDREWRV